MTTDSDTETTYGPLLVNAEEAAELAERLTDWYLFPVEGKVPMCPWQSNAATGPEDVKALWQRVVNFSDPQARSGVAIACDRSGIFVLDEDRDWREDTENYPDAQKWAVAIDSGSTLILPSSGKGRPHYYFRQPTDGPRVAERTWPGGDVKSKGIIVLGKAPPIFQPSAAGGGEWTPADVNEAIPPLVELIGRRRESADDEGGYSSHRVTKEEFYNWIEQEPGEHFGGRLIPVEYEQSFIDRLVERFQTNVDQNTSRRIACRDAVHTAVIESYQGIYSLSSAYDALLDAYEEMRTYGPGDCSGAKGWTQQRRDDYHAMWETEIHKPDALRSAEESYDEVVERLSSGGLGLEITEDDREEDAYCMEVIFAASSGDPDEEPDVEEEPPPTEEEQDELDWEGVGITTPESETAQPAQPASETPPSRSPVVLHEDAKSGPLWDMCSGLIGQHELPHEALMVTMAAWTGAVLGSAGAGAMYISDDRHGPELCVCMVGTSAVAHKSGTVGFGHMVYNDFWDMLETGVGAPGVGSGFFREVSGIESGQAFIEIWPTAADIAGGEGIGRAVIMVEPELTTMWKKAARKGSTIPEEIRKAWDGAMLTVRGIRAGNHRVLPDNYRFSAVGATIHSLAAKTIVESGADISGDGNRWLWCWGQEVPKPVKGVVSFKDHPLVEALRDQVRGVVTSVEEARQAGQWPGSAPAQGNRGVRIEFGEPKVTWTDEADEAWLDANGNGVRGDHWVRSGSQSNLSPVVKGLTSRGAQQIMRLAIGYEMVRSGENWAHLVRTTRQSDGQSHCISLEALKWAVAIEKYCADTVEHLFADTTGDDRIDELVSAITEIARDQGAKFKGYVLKADVVGSGFSKNQITALIAQAENQGALWTGNLHKEGRGGRPVVLVLPKWNPPPEVEKRSTK